MGMATGAMSEASGSERFDLFLSHGTPDPDWVRTLADELTKRGLRVYFDERELEAGKSWVTGLNDGLENSRYLVLIASSTSVDRPWVITEWQSVTHTSASKRRRSGPTVRRCAFLATARRLPKRL